MYKTAILMVCAGLLSAQLCQAGTVTGHAPAVNATLTGLYHDDGTLYTSSCSFTTMSVSEVYNGTNHPLTNTNTFEPISGVWQTTLRFQFSSAAWQTAASDVAFGVQVLQYIVGTSISDPPHDYFQEPLVDDIVTIGSGLNLFPVSTDDFADLNPRVFYLTQLTVDTSDLSGRTGYITFNSTTGSPFPWDNFPGATTIASGPNMSGYHSVAWLFPQVNNDGTHSPIEQDWPPFLVSMIP